MLKKIKKDLYEFMNIGKFDDIDFEPYYEITKHEIIKSLRKSEKNFYFDEVIDLLEYLEKSNIGDIIFLTKNIKDSIYNQI